MFQITNQFMMLTTVVNRVHKPKGYCFCNHRGNHRENEKQNGENMGKILRNDLRDIDVTDNLR